MGAADHTERVLREMHILFSKAEPFEGSKKKVIVDKAEVIDRLKELRECMFEMMSEYEMTVASRDKANREVQRENEERVNEATKNAEDIYAASIMFSDHSLSQIQDIMREAEDGVESFCVQFKKRIREEIQQLKSNQYELKGQLEGLHDTQMYMRLIQDENKRREKEKNDKEPDTSIADNGSYMGIGAQIKVNEELIGALGVEPMEEKSYSDIKPDIKINEAYFEARERLNEEEQDETV